MQGMLELDCGGGGGGNRMWKVKRGKQYESFGEKVPALYSWL